MVVTAANHVDTKEIRFALRSIRRSDRNLAGLIARIFLSVLFITLSFSILEKNRAKSR